LLKNKEKEKQKATLKNLDLTYKEKRSADFTIKTL
jgi:hypothetical protein